MATPIGDEGRNEEFEKLREEFNRLSSTVLRERINFVINVNDPSRVVLDENNNIKYYTKLGRENVAGQIDLEQAVKSLKKLNNELTEEDLQGDFEIPDQDEQQERREAIEDVSQQLQAQSASRRANQTPVIQEIRVNQDGSQDVINAIKPQVVTRFGGTLPFDAQSVQTQNGTTVTDNRGDTNIRLNAEMVLTHEQFITLGQIRTSGNRLRIVSASYSGPATFDQLKFERIPDANGVVSNDGTTQEDAIYKVQLQTKEQSDEENELLFNSNDDN